jgi:ABC-type Fe3+-hydroxamate transport system substrate-binding protein
VTGVRGGATGAGEGSWGLRSDSAKSLDVQRELSAWDALPAVKNRRVYLLVGDDLVVPGPRVVDATRTRAQTLRTG